MFRMAMIGQSKKIKMNLPLFSASKRCLISRGAHEKDSIALYFAEFLCDGPF